MKKLAYAFAAFAVVAPTLANAEELGVRVDGDRDMYRDRDFRAARAEFAYGEHDAAAIAARIEAMIEGSSFSGTIAEIDRRRAGEAG